MANPASIVSASARRAAQAADAAADSARRAGGAAAIRRNLKAIQDLEHQGRTAASISAHAPVPEKRFAGASKGLEHTDRARLMNAYGDVESALADDIANGVVSDEYLDYLRHMEVNPETIEAVRSGALPMDPASRAQRARAMGLDPDMTWHRADYPGRNEFLGRWRNGLVYANADKELANSAAQAAYKHNYPLTGPSSGIHGIDRTLPTLEDPLGAQSHLAFTYGFGQKDFKRTNSVLREPLGHNRQEALVALGDRLETAKADPEILLQARQGNHRPYPPGQKPPSWEFVETPAFVDDMKAKGTAGTLVRDEADTSVAFSPTALLRHAALAVFDPSKASSRNILQGLMVPIAVGAAASQGQPSLVDGLEVK